MDSVSILIVEDERIIALDLKQQLVSLGYSVLAIVSSGEAAIAAAQQLRPAIILMDIYIEGSMDGIEAARHVYGRYRIPIVFLTAFSADDLVQRATESLPFGYLLKPYDARELHATLQVTLARSRFETKLASREARLQQALHAAALAVWEWDTGTGTVELQGDYQQLLTKFGKAKIDCWEEFRSLAEASEQTRLDEAIYVALKHGGQISLHLRGRDAENRPGWIEIFAKVFLSSADGTPRLVGVLRDITERRNTEEKLRQAGAVFDTIVEAIMILDRDLRVLCVNPAFQTLTGYAPEEIVGQSAETMLQARRRDDTLTARLEKSDTVQWQGEAYCRRKNGSIIPVLQSIGSVQDAPDNTIQYVVALVDISALRYAEDELRFLAHHDPLTGLPNRLQLKDLLTRVLTENDGEKAQVAVVFLDLDGFKLINDAMGHATGDLLLQGVANRLRGALRRTDSAARLGGDEFVVVMAQFVSSEDVARAVRKLLEVLSEPFDVGPQRLVITASAGIALFPQDGESVDALLQAADSAMFHVKGQGRGRFAFHTKEIVTRSHERIRMEQGLRQALKNSELEVYFQPLVSLRDGTVSALEALVRWRHPEQGLLGPDRFIAIAEETGLIDPIGQWVLAQACRLTTRWVLSNPNLRLAVNISVRQFQLGDVQFQVRNALHQSGFPPAKLELEFTESTWQEFRRDDDRFVDLRQLGVTLAIDDFGTGYSSLSSLRHLPIDRLKIDRTFIQDIAASTHDQAIAQTICALGRVLKLGIVAEGVETIAQLEVLKQMGCDEVQGFLLCRPFPARDLEQALGSAPPWASLVSLLRPARSALT